MKLAELSNNSFEWKTVTFRAVKTYTDPFYIFFQGSTPHNPQDLYAPSPMSPGCPDIDVCYHTKIWSLDVKPFECRQESHKFGGRWDPAFLDECVTDPRNTLLPHTCYHTEFGGLTSNRLCIGRAPKIGDDPYKHLTVTEVSSHQIWSFSIKPFGVGSGPQHRDIGSCPIGMGACWPLEVVLLSHLSLPWQFLSF